MFAWLCESMCVCFLCVCVYVYVCVLVILAWLLAFLLHKLSFEWLSVTLALLKCSASACPPFLSHSLSLSLFLLVYSPSPFLSAQAISRCSPPRWAEVRPHGCSDRPSRLTSLALLRIAPIRSRSLSSFLSPSLSLAPLLSLRVLGNNSARSFSFVSALAA